MPPITRSRTRKLVDDLKTAPYYSRDLAAIKKHKTPSVAKLEALLERQETPDLEELVGTLLKIGAELGSQINQNQGLHILGDVVFKSATGLRGYIKDNSKNKCGRQLKGTQEFMNAWINEGIVGLDDDTTLQADLIRDYIKDKYPTKAKNAKFVKDEYEKHKAWMQICFDRCNLVRGGIDGMPAQVVWDNLKNMAADLESGKADFLYPAWTQYALDAIEEVKVFKYKMSGGKVTTITGDPIIP